MDLSLVPISIAMCYELGYGRLEISSTEVACVPRSVWPALVTPLGLFVVGDIRVCMLAARLSWRMVSACNPFGLLVVGEYSCMNALCTFIVANG